MRTLGDLFAVLIIPLAWLLVMAAAAVVLAMPNGVAELLG